MKASLSVKIAGLVAIPFILSLVYSGIYLKRNLEVSRIANEIVKNSHALKATSGLIHSLQKERGMTALFLNGKLNKSELDKQRENTNQRQRQFDDEFHLSVSEKTKRHPLKAHEAYNSAREIADAGKASNGETIKRYSGAISSLIDFDVDLAIDKPADGLELNLLSISFFELGKESAGLLRARLASYLAENKPLTTEQFSELEGLYNGVNSNIASPALIITEESQKKLDEFKNSNDWKMVLASIETVTNKYTQGDYGVDSFAFFNTATSAIENLGAIILSEINIVSEKISERSLQAQRAVWISITIISISTIVILFLSAFLIKGIPGRDFQYDSDQCGEREKRQFHLSCKSRYCG
jgi:methyl-accepting chemotaxis protein